MEAGPLALPLTKTILHIHFLWHPHWTRGKVTDFLTLSLHGVHQAWGTNRAGNIVAWATPLRAFHFEEHAAAPSLWGIAKAGRLWDPGSPPLPPQPSLLACLLHLLYPTPVLLHNALWSFVPWSVSLLYLQPLFGMYPPSSGPEPQLSGALPSGGSLFSRSLHCRAERWSLSLLFPSIISSPLFPSAWKALHLNTPTSSCPILSPRPCGLPAFPHVSLPSESSASASSSFSLPHFSF